MYEVLLLEVIILLNDNQMLRSLIMTINLFGSTRKQLGASHEIIKRLITFEDI